jgi:hypothetical protein
MRTIHISGYKRLGIFCSILWIFLAATGYFLGIIFHPSFLTNAFTKLYIWVEGGPSGEKIKGIDLIQLNPTADGLKLSLFVFLPVLICWIVLYVIPCSIRWVREGFQHDNKRDA